MSGLNDKQNELKKDIEKNKGKVRKKKYITRRNEGIIK